MTGTSLVAATATPGAALSNPKAGAEGAARARCLLVLVDARVLIDSPSRRRLGDAKSSNDLWLVSRLESAFCEPANRELRLDRRAPPRPLELKPAERWPTLRNLCTIRESGVRMAWLHNFF